jgi:hypothetical protein
MAHGPPGFSGRHEARHVLPVERVKPLGEEAIERAADHVLRIPAKHRLGGSIEKDYVLIVIDCDDRVHCGRDYLFEEDVRRIFEHSMCHFGTHPLSKLDRTRHAIPYWISAHPQSVLV